MTFRFTLFYYNHFACWRNNFCFKGFFLANSDKVRKTIAQSTVSTYEFFIFCNRKELTHKSRLITVKYFKLFVDGIDTTSTYFGISAMHLRANNFVDADIKKVVEL